MLSNVRAFKARHWIAVACGALVIVRAVFPGLRIDEVSFWLFLVGSIVLLIPDIGDLIARLRKVKKGDFELEFDHRLDDLKRRTEETESIIESEEIDFGEVPESVRGRIVGSLVEPRAALITLAVEIENRIRELAEIHDIRTRGRFFSPRRAIEAMVATGRLDAHLRSLFEDFWAIRNDAMHGRTLLIEREQLYSLVELGMRILRMLYTSSPDDFSADGKGA